MDNGYGAQQMNFLVNRLASMDREGALPDLINALNYNSMMIALQQGLISKEEVQYSELFQCRETDRKRVKRR